MIFPSLAPVRSRTRPMAFTLPENLCLVSGLAVVFLICSSPAQAWARQENESSPVVITREDIQRSGFVNIVDLLNQIPGVRAGDSFVLIRGSPKVRVLLEGRSINETTSSHGGVKWYMVSLKSIERIEILKGQGGVEYGDDSSGGVIVITTGKKDAVHGNTRVYWGNLGVENYEVNLQGSLGEWAASLNGGYGNSDGYRINDGKKKKIIGGKVAWTGSDRDRVNLGADYLLDERGNPGLPRFPTPWARQYDETLSSVLSAEFRSWSSTSSFDDSRRENEDPAKGLDTFFRVQKLRQDISGRPSFRNCGIFKCGTGFEYAQAWGEKIDRRKEESFWDYGAKDFSPKFLPVTFSLGLRGNFYSEFGEVLNPELKITAKRRWATLELKANRTNDIPSFMQRFNETSSTRPNPDLTMERASNLSLSTTPNLPHPFGAAISLFHNIITDRITYVRGDGGIGRYENFGRVTYQGLEGLLEWELRSGLKLKCGCIFLNAVNESTGNRLPGKPRNQFNTDIMWSPTPKFSLAFNTNAFSKQFTRADNREEAQGYVTVDMRSEYKLGKGVSLFTEMKNLMNRKYLYGDGYPAPFFTWISGVSYKF